MLLTSVACTECLYIVTLIAKNTVRSEKALKFILDGQYCLHISMSAMSVNDCIHIGKTMVNEHGTSAIFDHLSCCHSTFSCNSVSIIDTGINNFETIIKEANYLKAQNPKLNRQLPTHGTLFLLNIS